MRSKRVPLAGALVASAFSTLLAQAPPASTATEKPASIEGSVSNAASGEPLVRAHVTLRGFGNQGQKTYGAMTGPDGKFSVTSMASGTYTVMAERVGFVTNLGNGRGAEQITLAPGDARTSVNVKLIPCGAITGRVLNPEGDPVESISVSTNNHNSYLNATSDEKGNYRLGGLAPGKYHISAKPSAQPLPPEVRSDGTAEVHYLRTYFPNVPDEASSAPIEVAPGGETGGVDIHLLRGPITRVSGKILGMPPDAENINLLVQQVDGATSGSAVKADGTFDIWRLDPGKYWIAARQFNNSRAPLESAPVLIEMAQANIDNVELRIVPPADLQGQLEYDDDQARQAALTPTPNGSGPPTPGSTRGASPNAPNPQRVRRLYLQGVTTFLGETTAQIADNDSFTLENVQPGIYRVRISWEGVYVKSLLLGQTLVDGATLDLSSGTGGQSLSVRVSSAVAKLSGTVKDGDKAAPGVGVVLVGDEPGLTRNVRSTTADSTGAYTFPGLPPGKYKVIATKGDGGSILMAGKMSDENQALADSVELAPKDIVTRDLKLH